jgi:hypothetical protein
MMTEKEYDELMASHPFERPEKPNICEKCEKWYPWYCLSKVQIFSREFIGKVQVCDFCYVDYSGERLRDYKGFSGWIRKKLVDHWEKVHTK